MNLNIAIAGGGIAGLTAAIALLNNGHAVTLFEQAASLDDIGAGIQLSPNARKALTALGLADAIKTISFEPETLQLLNGKNGRILSDLPFKKLMQHRFGAPYLVTHRGDLQRVLLTAAKANSNIKIETSKLIDRFNEAADGIEITGENFDVLIAADGISSALRAQIDANAEIVLDDQTAWRATLPLPNNNKNAVSVYMNSGAHLVAYKMGARPVLNLVYVSGNSGPPTARNFNGEARELISAASNWKAWPLASVHSNTWHKGRAVMIGDAAHAMTPHAAQGGAMAIEDAVVLADCIKNHSNVQAAFAAYQAARQPRIARVKALSNQNRAIYQMEGFMALGRNVVMPLLPPALVLKRLDWLYGWNP